MTKQELNHEVLRLREENETLKQRNKVLTVFLENEKSEKSEIAKDFHVLLSAIESNFIARMLLKNTLFKIIKN